MQLITNKKKCSRLKPDAPIFVPGSPSKSTPGTEPLPKAQSKEITKELLFKVSKKQEKEERKAASLAKKVGKKAAGQVKTHGMDPRVSLLFLILTRSDLDKDLDKPGMSSPGYSAVSNNTIMDGDVSTTEKSKFKRVRFPNKRLLAKSEPASRARESLDGQQDSDVTTAGSSEGQSIIQAPSTVSNIQYSMLAINIYQQRRRVSAPSDPPASQETRHTRSRGRNRHWRLRNRAAEKVGSGTLSSLGTTSGDTSTEDHIVPPVSSPAAGVLIPEKDCVALKVSFAASR
jgi:hypothetical protein